MWCDEDPKMTLIRKFQYSHLLTGKEHGKTSLSDPVLMHLGNCPLPLSRHSTTTSAHRFNRRGYSTYLQSVDTIFSLLSLFWRENRRRLMRSSCCLYGCVHLSAHRVSSCQRNPHNLFRLMRLMRSSCCQPVYPPQFLDLWSLWDHLAVCVPPIKFRFLYGSYCINGKQAIGSSQNFLL